MNKKVQYFSRLRKILKANGWRPIIATISAFTVLYFLKYLYDFCLSNEWSWISAIISLATIGGLYNKYCQTKNEDAKDALLKDWHDLPIIFHLIIVFVALAFLLITVYKKYFLDLFNNNENDIKNIKHIAYGR